jgi:hypothetical protein
VVLGVGDRLGSVGVFVLGGGLGLGHLCGGDVLELSSLCADDVHFQLSSVEVGAREDDLLGLAWLPYVLGQLKVLAVDHFSPLLVVSNKHKLALNEVTPTKNTYRLSLELAFLLVELADPLERRVNIPHLLLIVCFEELNRGLTCGVAPLPLDRDGHALVNREADRLEGNEEVEVHLGGAQTLDELGHMLLFRK